MIIGYIVHSDLNRETGRRTYACVDYFALNNLILHLTGRAATTYPHKEDSITHFRIPIIEGINIGYPFQIWESLDEASDSIKASSAKS